MTVKISALDPTSDKVLYEQVADHVQALITEGTLQPGDRLPSVRKLHNQLSISVSTVLEAYRLLEDRGLITARPQSGYYVKPHALEVPLEANPSLPLRQVSTIDTSLAFQVVSSLRNPDLIQLGAAVPGVELFPTAALNRLMGQVLRSHPTTVHHWDSPAGDLDFCHEVAKRMINAGCAVSPEQVVPTNGAVEAIFLSLRAVTQPGDTVAIESPAYFAMLETMKFLKLKALELPSHPRDGICLEALATALNQHKLAAVMLVSNFSNPLGSCMSDTKKYELVQLLNQHDVPLVEDDVYGDLQFQGVRPKAIKAFDTKGLVLYCASFSKTLSPGLRVGWSIPGRYQSQVEQLKMVINYKTAIAPELTIASFLANGGYDRHLRQLRRAFQTQIQHMTQAICDYFPAETRITQPQGGHILWVELPPEFNSLELYDAAMAHNINIAPGVMFSPSGSYRNCFRLNAGLPWTDTLDQAMQTLGSLCKSLLYRNWISQNSLSV